MRRCSRCILPETYQGISFNDEGVCNYCLEYRPFHRAEGKDKLLEVLSSRPRAGEYDCVVPISGGKDSTFILRYVVKELGLRPLAVSYDSGFQTAIARENVRTACTRLSVPLVVATPPGDSQRMLLKEWILLSGRVGWMFGPCGGNCEAFLRTAAISAARANGAPFVMWGSSALESMTIDAYTDYRELGTRRIGRVAGPLKGAAERLGRLARDPSKIRNLPRLARSKVAPYVGRSAFRFCAISIQQRIQFGMPLRVAVRPRFVPPFTNEDPQFVHFFDYVEWDSVHSIQTLETELGWRHPPGVDSRFDCAVHCLGNFDHLRLWGISHDGVNFCNFVREGKMSRAEALAREATIASYVKRERAELIASVGLGGHHAVVAES
jgi:hypothetical protein